MNQPLMPKATAIWLIENTALTFEQIAKFCGLHALEVQGIADGDVATSIKGMDPISNGQITREDLEACQKDPKRQLQLAERKQNIPLPKEERRVKRYTPLSKRQERPDAIAWLIRHHPELNDAQIGRLVGTTKPTIVSIRNRKHWNISNIKPLDPVTLGLCRQLDLDEEVAKAVRRAERAEKQKARQARKKEKEQLGKQKETTNPENDKNKTQQTPTHPQNIEYANQETPNHTNEHIDKDEDIDKDKKQKTQETQETQEKTKETEEKKETENIKEKDKTQQTPTKSSPPNIEYANQETPNHTDEHIDKDEDIDKDKNEGTTNEDEYKDEGADREKTHRDNLDAIFDKIKND